MEEADEVLYVQNEKLGHAKKITINLKGVSVGLPV